MADNIVEIFVSLKWQEKAHKMFEKDFTIEKVKLMDTFDREYDHRRISGWKDEKGIVRYAPEMSKKIDIFSSQYAWLIPHIREDNMKEKNRSDHRLLNQ